MTLKGSIVNTCDLGEQQVADMYQLMVNHYNNVDPEVFNTDLAEKNWTILLTDAASTEIKGFSTQMVFEHQYENETLFIFFTGDTIIHPSYWGSQALPVTLGSLMQRVLANSQGKKLYWLLISKGYRTYRFLPAFFFSFYPRYDEATPAWEQGLIASLGQRKFPDRYNSTNGILESGAYSQSLRKEFALLSKAHCKNDHIRFFLKANPYFGRGDELMCIAQFHEENLKPYLWRSLKPINGKQFELTF